jgi:hypothetical protein
MDGGHRASLPLQPSRANSRLIEHAPGCEVGFWLALRYVSSLLTPYVKTSPHLRDSSTSQ